MSTAGTASSQPDFIGIRIDGGPAPFRIYQQHFAGASVAEGTSGEVGFASISLHGRWHHPPTTRPPMVQLRVVHEDTAQVVVPWQDATAQESVVDRGEQVLPSASEPPSWRHTFHRVPAGGLYRIETRLVLDARGNVEWSPHGDVVHHIGVGDLWVIAGQSNAAGYGRGPVNDPPRLGVHVLRNDETWDIATHLLNETTRSTHPNMEGSNPGHSPYLRFGKDLQDALGYPIGLIATSLGGSALDKWNPVENPDAVLFKNMLHCISIAGGRVRGMVWYQGESDANEVAAPTYERRFADFAIATRQALGDITLPILIAQLNRVVTPQTEASHRAWTIIREAQRHVSMLAGPAGVVPTLDLPLSDLIHNSPDGNLTLGTRKARLALERVYGKPFSLPVPDVGEAVFDAERRHIFLTYNSVPTHLVLIGAGEADFRVEDESGVVPVKNAVVKVPNVVRLELERLPTGATVVHGAWGANPPAFLRDAEANIPALGFYGLPVQEASKE
ncbi:MAG: sialate O-acetylesterase [Candidatus Methylacidiphilales bacterium]|nr:sialate O-acetylesterase [Candidatus Methylacidiphilales bacterium]